MENNSAYYEPQPTRPTQYVNWKEIIIKILIAILFLVLLIWLFPMPSLDPIHDHMFNENVMMMKDAAKNYYSNERLPWKVGEKKKLTLQEMLDKHLLLPIVDGEGNMCNANTSYVEVTKLDTEWQLKAYLDCGTKADYVVEYLGCTDYCALNECKVVEKKEEKVITPSKQSVSYEYEFVRTTGSSWWTDWSEWNGKKDCANGTCEEQARDLYKARLWSSDPVYSYEYERTVYQGKKWEAKPVYQYEYKRTLVRGRKKITKIDKVDASYWTGFGAETSTRENCPSGTCQEQAIPHQRTVQTGTKEICHGAYGNWYQSATKGPSASAPGGNSDTVKYTKGSYAYGGKYYWIEYRRNWNSCATKTYEPEYGTETYYTYKYNRLVQQTKDVDNSYYVYTDWIYAKNMPSGYTQFDQKTETTWAAKAPDSNWTATGNKKQTADNGKWVYTDWVAVLPSGYTKHQEKKETMWSELTVVDGWTATGNKKQTKDNGSYIYTDYVLKENIPQGYEIVDKKTEYRYRYKQSNKKTEYTWSTSKTLAGWTATGKSRIKG